MKPLVLVSLTALASAMAALAMASAAAARPASEDTCFLTRDLRGHTVGTDGHTLYLGVNGTDVYQVTTSNNCLTHLTGSDPIVLKDRGLGKICNPMDLELRARGTQCFIGKLTKMTSAEASALPKRLQP
ncbi:MAG TPA: hypothetical protein VHN39_15945 [Phenylobacterium sp.]|jgi:hypothetical protein|nr:hypothetical protein [Phenylobacterium sp.]